MLILQLLNIYKQEQDTHLSNNAAAFVYFIINKFLAPVTVKYLIKESKVLREAEKRVNSLLNFSLFILEKKTFLY